MKNRPKSGFRSLHAELLHRIGFLDEDTSIECLGLIRDISLCRPRFIDPRVFATVYYIDSGQEYTRQLEVCQVSSIHTHPAILVSMMDLQEAISKMSQKIRDFGTQYGADDNYVKVLNGNLRWLIEDLLIIMLRNEIDIRFNQDFLISQACLLSLR